MTRTQSTLVWGIALLLAAGVLAWAQSLPWTLAAAGAVPTIVGLIKLMNEENANAKANAAKAKAVKASAFIE